MLEFDLSVIVPTHNRTEYLPGLLASLASQSYPAERWELIIVDDGSSDGTDRFVEGYRGPRPRNMRVIRQPQSGVACARNNGARVAHGRGLLFLDDDMIAAPSLVNEHALVHRQDRTAVVIGHISVPAGGREAWVAWEDAQLMRHYDALKSGVRIPGPRDFYTGNVSVSRALFESVGGFRTDLPRTEDVELGYRLKAAGANFYYRTGADSLHLGRHTFDRWLRNAHIYGRVDVLLAWEAGHTELQQVIFRWFRNRHPLSRVLVRLCVRVPALERPAVSILHQLGTAAYRTRLRALSTGIYSAINNLAYWLGVAEGMGRTRFLAYINTGSTDCPAHEPERVHTSAELAGDSRATG